MTAVLSAMAIAMFAQDGLASGDVKKLAGGMTFTEGPTADAQGRIYFTDIPKNRIMRWDGRELSVWRENSGGANGLKFDRDGSLVACEGALRRVTRISPDQKVQVLADSYEGRPLNSPNDLAFDAQGGLYFTDPGGESSAVYYLPPRGGKLIQVARDLGTPNGIEASKDRLYIVDTSQEKIFAYRRSEDGTLREKSLFCSVRADGIKLDEKGNLYAASRVRRGVVIFSPAGTEIGVIPMPETSSNCCFSGKALYITATTSLYAVPMKVRGYSLEGE